MTDLDLLITGAMVMFIAFAGAYVAMRHRANETPVQSHSPTGDVESDPTVIRPQTPSQ